MGSEKYPYKGLLDLLANRGFSNGTNAWTDTDHTAYTISTAGEQGFLQLLPIYVDHILYPTITNAGSVPFFPYTTYFLTISGRFVTEVSVTLREFSTSFTDSSRFTTLTERAKTLESYIAKCKGGKILLGI